MRRAGIDGDARLVDVVSVRKIRASVRRVAEFAADPSNVPAWYSKILSVEWLWYLRYGLPYREVDELLVERGIEVDHDTAYQWVHSFTTLLGRRGPATFDSIGRAQYAAANARARGYTRMSLRKLDTNRAGKSVPCQASVAAATERKRSWPLSDAARHTAFRSPAPQASSSRLSIVGAGSSSVTARASPRMSQRRTHGSCSASVRR